MYLLTAADISTWYYNLILDQFLEAGLLLLL